MFQRFLKLYCFFQLIHFNTFGQFVMPSFRSVNSKANLVMDLDFANSLSYSGSGTDVLNVVDGSNSTKGVIVNSPTFNSYPKSVSFNGTNQYILTGGNLSSNFSATTSGAHTDFTMNIWINPTVANSNGVVVSELGANTISSGWHDAQIVFVNGILKFAVWPYNNGTAYITSSIATPINNWYMVSLVYDGVMLSAYVNGVLAGTYGSVASPFIRQAPYNYSNSLNYCIACSDGTSIGATGYGAFKLARFKVYSVALNGTDLTAIYNNEQGNFATYISSSNATLTGASVVAQSPFSGGGNSYYTLGSTTSYVSFPGQNSVALGTGDYTIEWFQYQTVSTTWPRIFWYGTSPSLGVSLEGYYYVWPSVNAMASYGTILNTWIHFALVRISGKLYLYKNGILISSASGVANTTNITDASSTFYIGTKAASGLSGEQFAGYITNFRIVKGLGVYTGNFTTPTSALNAITNANPYGGSNTAAIPAGYTSVLLIP